MADIGAKISIDGEKQFRQELQQITQQGKTLSAEMEKVTTAFENADDAEKDYTEITRKLNEQVENQKKLVDKLKEAVQKSAEKTGESSTETLKWKEKLAKAEKGLSDLEAEAKDAAGGVKNLGDEEEKTSEKTSVFGDVLKANLAAEAIKKGVEALASTVKKLAEFMGEALKETAEYADTVGTLAKTTGLSTDAIQEYQYAAGLLDVEFSTIEGSLTKLTSKMSAARDGNADAAEAFAALGIQVTDANGDLRDSSEVFEEAVAALGNIENTTERDAAAMDLFGKSAKDLNPLIEAGAEAMSDLREEAHRVGAVMDKDTLSAMSDVQDGMDRLEGTWSSLKRTLGAKIGVKVLPALEKLVSTFQKLAETGDLSSFTKEVSDQLGKLVKKIPDFVQKIAKELPKALKELAKSNLWQDLAEAIGDTLAAIFQNLPELLEAGGELLGSLIQGAVMILPNMISRLVNGFDDELDELDKVTNEHVEAVRKKIEELPDVLSDVEDDIATINAKQAEAEKWIKIFDDLSKKTNPTAADTERLQQAVDRLNDLFPNLGLLIDEETGKWNMNTAEIRDNISALADRAKAEAYINAASDLWAEIIHLEKDRDELQNELESLSGKITQKSNEKYKLEYQRDALERLNEKYRDGKISADEYAKSVKDLTGWTSVMTDTIIAQNGEAITPWAANMERMELQIGNVEKEIGALEREKQPLIDGIGEVSDAIDGLNEDVDYFYEKADELTTAVIDPIRKAADDVYDEGKKVSKRLDEGLAQGLKDNEGLVVSAAHRVIKNAIAGMREEAQIKSPSRLTRKLIGRNLALGVVRGWDDVMKGGMRNTLSLSGAIGDLTREAGNVTTNNETNYGGFTINVQGAPGMNENALADTIMMRIQRAVDGRRQVFGNELHIQ